MAQQLTQGFFTSTAVVSPVTTAETIILTSPGIEIPAGANGILVLWKVLIALAAGTTSVTWRIRRGAALTGTLVESSGALTSGIAASSLLLGSGFVVDQPPNLGDIATYSITFQAAGAGANASTTSESIAIFAY